MGLTANRTGRYSPHDGITLPAEGFTGTAEVPCPDVGDEARAWWANWATSQYAHFFGSVEWQNLADTARLQDRFYKTVETKYAAEVRQRENNLFGLGNRARLHVSEAGSDGDPDAAPAAPRRRDDPRLRAV